MENVPSPQRSHTNKKILRILLILCIIGFFWIFFSKTQQYYSDIQSGTIDLSRIGTRETTQLRNAATNVNTAVDNTRLINFTDDPFFGIESASVHIVMFGDFECPHCRKVFTEVKSMLALHGHEVYFVYRDFPITELHSGAKLAAEAAQCANAQGKFWQYHDKLYLVGSTNTMASLKSFARQLNLDTKAFDSCLENHFFADEVEADYQDGLALHVTGTPTFFFNGTKVPGVISSEGFTQIIEYLKNR